MAARGLWSGVLSFGLVNIPVKLQSASRDERPHFHLLHAKDDAPIRYERICEREKKPVPWSEIVKGYEVKKGEVAVLTPEDFKHAALNRSETIDILAFVDAGEIDARYFETPYYLVPGQGGRARVRAAARDDAQVGEGRRRADRDAAVAAPGGGDAHRRRAGVHDAQVRPRGRRHARAGFARRQVAEPARDGAGREAGRGLRRHVEARAVPRQVHREPAGHHQDQDAQGGRAAAGRAGSGRADG